MEAADEERKAGPTVTATTAAPDESPKGTEPVVTALMKHLMRKHDPAAVRGARARGVDKRREEGTRTKGSGRGCTRRDPHSQLLSKAAASASAAAALALGEVSSPFADGPMRTDRAPTLRKAAGGAKGEASGDRSTDGQSAMKLAQAAAARAAASFALSMPGESSKVAASHGVRLPLLPRQTGGEASIVGPVYRALVGPPVKAGD
jgi:hypothetical protein